MFDIYGNRISQTTANCYVVSEAGYYKFPLVYGNALKNGAANTAAYTNNGASTSHDFVDYNGTVITTPYIEELSGTAASVQLSIADTDAIFTDISLVDGVGCRYIQFKVASVPATGANGVVSVKDSSGVIMWSWHIWVWEYDLTPVAITNSTDVTYNILPVNLATKLDEGTVCGSGTTGYKNWFYQWGRPIPMLCPSAYNGITNHASYGALSFEFSKFASSFILGIQNPATFYSYNSDGAYNWFDSSSYYNLWDASLTSIGTSDNIMVKTVYDPCPIGFHVPNGNTFTYFSTSNVVGSFTNGWKFKRNPGDMVGVFFPVSGHRNSSDGSLQNVDSSGFVWLSSAYSQSGANYLYVDSSYVGPQSYSYRANGLSVRPVQEDYYGESKITTIRIDQTITDPASMITRIVSQGGVEAIRANSHRYIGMVSDGVMQLMQLSDTDGTKFVDGTDASVYLGGMTSLPLASSGTGNVADVWMKLPQFYWKCEQYATDIWDFTVAYGMKPDDTYKTWDGKDLIGVYEAYYDGFVDWLTSVSGVDSTGLVSQSTFKTYARNRGEGYTLVKWKHHCMMAMLFYTYYGTTNSQAVCGSGTNSYDKTTGATNSLGMTDTTTANGNSMSINFWGLENWWGNKYEWLDNVVVDARVWTITEDDGTTRTAGTGGSSDGWITKLLLGENIDMIPTAVGASESTGFCDYYYQSGSSSRVVRRSGYVSSTNGGVACAAADDVSSYAHSPVGSRLAFRGDYVIV